MNKQRPVKGVELGGTRTLVPGADYGNQSSNVGGGGTGSTTIIINPTSIDADSGSVGATFLGDDIIDRGSMGSIPVFTARTILAWEVLFLPGITNGIKLDVWKTTYANYETVSIANSIFPTFASKPYIIAANKNKSVSLAGVDVNLLAGDILVFVCLSRGTPRWCQCSLQTVDV